MRGLVFASDRASTVPYPHFCHCDRVKKSDFSFDPFANFRCHIFVKFRCHIFAHPLRGRTPWEGAPLEGSCAPLEGSLKIANGSNEKSRFWKAKILQKFCVPILRTVLARSKRKKHKMRITDEGRRTQRPSIKRQFSLCFMKKRVLVKWKKSITFQMKIELQKWWWEKSYEK